MDFSETEKLEPATTDAPCERCGNFDALEIAGKFLCGDCVTLAGCGCAGDE